MAPVFPVDPVAANWPNGLPNTTQSSNMLFSFESGLFSKILKLRAFTVLGVLSYSIFLNHAFVQMVILAFAKYGIEGYFKIPIFTIINGNNAIGTNLWMGDAIYLLMFVCVIGPSFLTYKYIEIPLKN
jgi:peptidoglycan/LPS O-acetylase OafA/YrhL